MKGVRFQRVKNIDLNTGFERFKRVFFVEFNHLRIALYNREYCRGLNDDTLGFMVAEFNEWKLTEGLTAEELSEREAELNTLFQSCRHSALNPSRKYYTTGGDGYFFGRVGHDVMLM